MMYGNRFSKTVHLFLGNVFIDCVMAWQLHEISTWFGFDIRGVILTRDMKGALRLDLTKYMLMYVPTYNNYSFNSLTPVVWNLWRC
jgi:hypothetical protein